MLIFNLGENMKFIQINMVIFALFFSIVLKRIIILLISSFLVAFYIVEGGLIFLNNLTTFS